MSAKKNPVTTPLHLLQQLSHSLLEHLENACSAALVDAEKMLAKLEKQRGKGQVLLHKARAKLQDAAVAGKSKAQAKAKHAIAELESLLEGLQERQAETRIYIAQLKRDAQESLKLAQGVGKVKDAAAKALDLRTAKPAAKIAVKKAPVAKVPAAKAPAVKAAAAKAPAAKPAARKPAAKPAAAKAVARKPAAKPAVKAPAKPAAAKPATKPAARPAAVKADPVAKPVAPAVQPVATDSSAS